MKYTFREVISASGRMAYVEIPFNVWTVCKKQGMLKVSVNVESEEAFETQLIPKGQGIYLIPLIASIANKYYPKEVLVSFEIIEAVAQKEEDGIDTTKHDIKANFELIKEPSKGYSGVACIAMLTGIPFNEVLRVMRVDKHQVTIQDIMDVLDYYKIEHAGKIVYQIVQLPKLCIIYKKKNKKNHFLIHFAGKYYDPADGMLDLVDKETFIGFLEVYE